MKALLPVLLLLGGGAAAGGYALYEHGQAASRPAPPGSVTVTLAGATGKKTLVVELARTEAEQARGLMYRTDLKQDGGMLFYPYPADGGPPRVANFWMQNTPTPLDILFIRADGTIARIAENTVPYSEAPISSNEPVAAVLELKGGEAANLGLSEGDKVTLPAK